MKTLTVLERLEKLEKAVGDVQTAVDNLFVKVQNAFLNHHDLSMGTVEVLDSALAGEEKFSKKLESAIANLQFKRAKERSEQEKKQLEQMVSTGTLKVTDKIKDNTLVVARTLDKDNNVLGVGREQFEFASVNAPFKEKLADQGVGFVLEVNETQKMEVLEIYEISSADSKVEVKDA